MPLLSLHPSDKVDLSPCQSLTANPLIINQLAEIISNSLSGKTSAVIAMNEKYYTVKRPKTKLVALMLKPLSRINFDLNDGVASCIKDSIEQYPYMDECISLCILGDRAFGWLSKFRVWRLKRKLSGASDAERNDAFKQIYGLIIPKDFFSYALLAMGLTGQITNAKEQKLLEEILSLDKSQE
jgi:hypothetical protein